MSLKQGRTQRGEGDLLDGGFRGGGVNEVFFKDGNGFVKNFWVISNPPLLKAFVRPCSKKVPLRGYKKGLKEHKTIKVSFTDKQF